MFNKLEILKNPNTIYNFKYTKEELFKNIESLLLENNTIVTIFKNDDDTYSIYNNKDLEDNLFTNPLISFSEKYEIEDLKQVYKTIRIYIENKILINKTINSYENRINKLTEENRIYIDSLNKEIKDITNIIYSDKEESKTLYGIIRKIINDSNDYYDCADNFRYAKIGDKYQEYLYKVKEEDGCCGFYDQIIDVDGIQYKIGFNYGH